jgi:hypothetical protein
MTKDSSVSMVSGYGEDDRAIGVRSPAEAKDFSSILCVQTGSGAHPASCTIGTGGPFPGGKARPRPDFDHLPPSSAEVVNEYELYILSPRASIGVLWDSFNFPLKVWQYATWSWKNWDENKVRNQLISNGDSWWRATSLAFRPRFRIVRRT